MTRQLTLGIDIGTTRMRALLLDPRHREVVAVVSARTPVDRHPDGDRRDPNEVWSAVTDLCRELGRNGAPMSEVVGLAVAAVGEELVLFDANGQSTGLIACWYVNHADSKDPDDPLFKLAGWYALRAAAQREDPALTKAVGFSDLGSWLLMRCSGSATGWMDRTHASRTGMLDPATGHWWAARLNALGGTQLVAPELVDSGTLVGEVGADTAAELGLPVGVGVHAGAHDHLCAALAAGVTHAGEVFISVGTSESQLVLIHEDWSTVAGFESEGIEVGFSADGNHKYVHFTRPSGRRVADLAMGDPRGRSIDELCADLEALTDITPCGVPVLRSDSEWRDPTAAALFREYEAQAIEAARLTRILRELTGGLEGGVHVAGRPTQQSIWRKLRIAYADAELTFSSLAEPSAVGAALLASGSLRG